MSTFQLADRLPLPAPPELLHVLLFLGLLLHLLAVNFLLGGGIMACATEWYGRKWGTERHRKLAAGLARAMPGAMALAMALGVAPFLFVQLLFGPFYLTAVHGLVWPWVATGALMAAGYVGWHLAAWRREQLGRHVLAVELASACCLALTALTFTATALLMNASALHGAAHPWHLLFFQDATLLPRWAHHLVGATAFAGLYVALYGLWRARRGEPEAGYWLFRYGLGWFLVPALAQFTGGSWLLWSLAERQHLLGGQQGLTALLAAGITCSMAGFVALVGSRGVARPERWAATGAVLMVATTVLMLLVRAGLRQARLGGLYDPAAAGVTAQWSPALAFLLVFALGAMAVAYMCWICFRLPFRPRTEGQ